MTFFKNILGTNRRKIQAVKDNFLTEEREADIEKFNDIFGVDTDGTGFAEKFIKLKPRFQNAGMSGNELDINWYIKNKSGSKEDIQEVQQLILDAQNRRGIFSRGAKDIDVDVHGSEETSYDDFTPVTEPPIQYPEEFIHVLFYDTDGILHNNSTKIAENSRYAVYDIHDYETSVNLGCDTGGDGEFGWCISGRYNKNKHLNIEMGRQHYDSYTLNRVDTFIFFLPKDKKDLKYALTIYKDGNFQFTRGTDDHNFEMNVVPDDAIKFPKFEYKGIITKDTFNVLTNSFDAETGLLDYVGAKVNDSIMIDIKKIVVAKSVTEIPEHAFKQLPNLVELDVQSKQITIGKGAFEACTSLSTVRFNGGNIKIGDSAFSDCTALLNLNFTGNSIKGNDGSIDIGATAFQSCISLTVLNLPYNVTSVGVGAFYGCTNLSRVDIFPVDFTAPMYSFAKCTSLSQVVFHCTGDISLYRNAFLGDTNIKKIVSFAKNVTVNPFVFETKGVEFTIECKNISGFSKYLNRENIKVVQMN